MSQSSYLRERTEQHKPKNTKSKQDDKQIYQAMDKTIEYLKERFKNQESFNEHNIIFERQIVVKEMIDFIKRNKIRFEFDYNYSERCIIPDGGILFLVNKQTNERKPLLFAEIKRQGTNDDRLAEGKNKQATGNAIERLGKNLTGIKSMMNHEKITPFVCFGWGCDFDEKEKTVLSKVSMLNEFYPLNRIYIFKKDGTSDYNYFSPVSMYFRREMWSVEEMFDVMKEIAETSLRYYIF